MAALVEGVWAAPEYLADVPDLLAREPSDVLVVDCMMFAVLAAAETTATPVAVLVHSAPGALAPPDGPGKAFLLGPINDVRKLAGRPALTRSGDAWSPHPTLCTSVPELDPHAGSVPGSVAYVGPVAERTPPSGWSLPWPHDDPRPLVLASFSTGYAWDQRSRLQRTLDAFADAARYRVLALTATADVGGLAVPDNAVPGVALDGETASADELAAAVGTVLTAPAYAAAARRLGTAVADAPGVTYAADVLERLR